MDLSYVFVHSGAEIVLLWLCLVGLALLQNSVVEPGLNAVWPEEWTIKPGFITVSQVDKFNWVSFLLWLTVNLFSSFVLHLPTLWTRRVQVRRPLQPLDPKWYDSLKKPFWNPSNLFFPLAWVPAKLLKSVVNAMMWEVCGRRVYALPILSYITCVVVADLWNQVFFVQHDLSGSVAVIWMLNILEWANFLATEYYLHGAHQLLYPLLFALLFAAALATHIAILNPAAFKRQELTAKVLSTTEPLEGKHEVHAKADKNLTHAPSFVTHSA
ncbi:hypothetical protein NDN08_000685 [Rhodosorus marinus]|uniref:Uncharacterized protein n=1 Tax=Rhodosorus marinus TaxID=101924 RepID=A0AAV8UNT3_9RHOD|nr:hypothetical protein NDN08_000685 [Rhodosorus marinus]